ncbi:MAG: efflux RND transporter periplasmic adaptor subunit, partial [Burkholderiales bacterium]
MFPPASVANRSAPANNNSNQYRRFLGAVISTVALAWVLAGCGKKDVEAPFPRPALAYKITPGGGTDIDVYSGDIRARYEVDHAFRVGGKIARRLVDAGAVVKRGQPLAELDPQDVKLAADAARSQVTAQQTEADFADAELKRYRDL